METKKLNFQEMENYNGGSVESFACSSGMTIMWTAAAAGMGTPLTWMAAGGALLGSAWCEAAFG